LALALAVGGGAYVVTQDDGSGETGEPEAVATDEKTSEEEPAAQADPNRLVALGIASERLHRAIGAGDEAHRESARALADKKTRPKKRVRKKDTRNKKSTRNKKTKSDKGSSALLPVLTQAGARRIIASHNDEITACFEKGLLRDPDFGGGVKVRMVIAAEGNVANADVVESTVDAEDVESCIVKRVESWTFPETGDGRVKVLTTPFRFKIQ
jgi:hypothetical protein